ncbi:flagellar hook-length control protein FliK [Halocynthiibacter sp.]|uniref:flagellar hook-length control protein FliK n=1 Tax=Halocynthiibacter sp. TaxID=1979210 RepID=UPI003C43729A
MATPMMGVDGEIEAEVEDDVTFAMVLADDGGRETPKNLNHPDLPRMMTYPAGVDVRAPDPKSEVDAPENTETPTLEPDIRAENVTNDAKLVRTSSFPFIPAQTVQGADQPFPLANVAEANIPDRSVINETPEQNLVQAATQREGMGPNTLSEGAAAPQTRSMQPYGDGRDTMVFPTEGPQQNGHVSKTVEAVNHVPVSTELPRSKPDMQTFSHVPQEKAIGDVTDQPMPEVSAKLGDVERQTSLPLEPVRRSETSKARGSSTAGHVLQADPSVVEKPERIDQVARVTGSKNDVMGTQLGVPIDQVKPPVLPVESAPQAHNSMRSEVVHISQVREEIMPPPKQSVDLNVPKTTTEAIAPPISITQAFDGPIHSIPETSPDELPIAASVSEGQSPSRAQPATPGFPGQTAELARFTHISRQLMEVAARNGDGPVELTLSPEELGRVRMNFTMQDGVLTVSLAAERGETLALMRRNIDALLQDFGDIGFSEINMDFSAFGNPSASPDGSSEGGLAEAATPGSPIETETSARPPVRISLDAQQSTGLDLRL